MTRLNLRDKKVLERRFDVTAAEAEDGAMVVEGYAAVFESPTVLYSCDGVDYSEQIARGAFDGAKMDDVIFNFNHSGRVFARTRNNTLVVNVDDHGLHIRADLSGTEEGRSLYNDIKGGYIDRMSFRFSVEADEYDRTNHMWTVTRIKRLYDVSAVDIPAYDDTSISARRTAAEEAEKAELERQRDAAAAAAMREMLMLKTKM